MAIEDPVRSQETQMIYAAPGMNAARVQRTKALLQSRLRYKNQAFLPPGWMPSALNQVTNRARILPLPTTPEDRAWILQNVALPDALADQVRKSLEEPSR